MNEKLKALKAAFPGTIPVMTGFCVDSPVYCDIYRTVDGNGKSCSGSCGNWSDGWVSNYLWE